MPTSTDIKNRFRTWSTPTEQDFADLIDASVGVCETLGNAATRNVGAPGGVAGLDSLGRVPWAQLPDAISGGLIYLGTWDAATNTPAIPPASPGNKGRYYKVAVPGTTNIDGTAAWLAGDWLVSNGATWDRIQPSEAVSSVAGKVGAVTLAAADIADSTALGRSLVTAASAASALSQLALGKGVTVYATAAELAADLTPPAGWLGWVLNDPVLTNNRVYIKTGASGSGTWNSAANDRLAPPEAVAGLAGAPETTVGLLAKCISLHQQFRYRDALAYPWSVSGQDGKTPLAIDRLARVALWDLLIQHNAASRDGVKYLLHVRDTAGKLAFAVDLQGGFIPALLKIPYTVNNPRLTGGNFSAIVTDAAGKTVLSADSLGRIGFIPSPELIQSLKSENYVAPSAFRGTQRAFNLRQISATLRLATIQDKDGTVYDARQRISGSLNTALVDASDPVHGVFWYGQSNAGNGNGTTVIETATQFPSHVMMFNNAPMWTGETAVNPATLNELDGAHNTTGQYPAIFSGFALEQYNRDAGRISPGYFIRTDWYGGQPLQAFQNGAQTWNNLMTAAAKMVEVCALYGRSAELRHLVFVQGESGPYGDTTYATGLGTLIDTIVPAIKTATGQSTTPNFVIVQINDNDDQYSTNGVDLGQLSVARARYGAGVTMAGPIYDCRLEIGPTHSVHMTALGRMVMSERVAAALETLEQGGLFKPLWPASVVRTNNLIDITFDLPAGNLAVDTDWVLADPLGFYGFRYTDDTSSAAIASVAITGANTVRVTLTATPTGANKLIKYAMETDQVSNDGWASGRGQLYSPTTKPSFYYRRGFAVPQYLRHYCVKFQESV